MKYFIRKVLIYYMFGGCKVKHKTSAAGV